MPYVMDHDEPSSWVTLANRYYDPKVGQQLYNQYLDQLEYAEKLGWDGMCVNEHHQNCYGTMPSPNVMAAMLVRRTTRAKIAILGNGLPLRENPLRIAEEIAMLDVASGGRVISGFVRGISAEYFSTGINPTHSRDRFYEAAELIVRSWTEEGPFPFDGRFYRYHYVNPWPRAIQKPHPPVWRPPGYRTEAWLRRLLATPPKVPSELEFDEADREGYLIYGSPATVRDKLRVFADELRAGILCSGMTGPSHEQTLEMMQLFAEEVMPHFREDARVDETVGVGR